MSEWIFFASHSRARSLSRIRTCAKNELQDLMREAQVREQESKKPHSNVGLFCVYMLGAISYSAKTN